MKFAVHVVEDHVVLAVSRDGGLSKPEECALRSNDMVFWRMDQDEFWLKIEDDTGQGIARRLYGPWAAGAAIRWCRMTAREIGFLTALYDGVDEYNGKKLTRENTPVTEVVYQFNDVVCKTYEELEAEYEKMPDVTLELGTFTVTTPALRVTDPCYTPDTRCAGVLQVLPGNWTARVLVGPTDWDTRVKQLQITHESLGVSEIIPLAAMVRTSLNAGVDSGQCGFFDEARYPRKKSEFEYEKGTFYAGCCELTLDEKGSGGGVLADGSGVLSRSGFGDGGYNVYAQKDSTGNIVALALAFIGDRYDEDEGFD